MSRSQRFARCWDWGALRCGGPAPPTARAAWNLRCTMKARPGQPRKYQTNEEAEVIALLCSAPPRGHKRWTIRLLETAARQRPGLVNVSRDTVRLMLKKTTASPGAS